MVSFEVISGSYVNNVIDMILPQVRRLPNLPGRADRRNARIPTRDIQLLGSKLARLCGNDIYSHA